MTWADAIVVSIFVVVCVLAVRDAHRNDWDPRHVLGGALFLLGAAGGLFLDDLLARSLPWWSELAFAVVIVAGAALQWSSNSEQ